MIKNQYKNLGIGDWGLGIGDWGLGIGPNPHFKLQVLTLYLKYIIFSKKLLIFN